MILAPMVRIGTLPLRILAKRYGADYCFTPEIIDIKLAQCQRVCQAGSDLVDYIHDRKELVLRVGRFERDHLILQIGSANPETALKAALLVKDDFAGIDLNCGCPKRFSTHGGMGSALLKNPDLLCSILNTLVQGQSLPVSCKIRLLPDLNDTVELVKRIAQTGIHSLTVHCRTAQQRYDVPADWSILPIIKPILEERHVALVVNGDIRSRADLNRFNGLSIMVARAAQNNPSCFSPSPAPLLQVHREYLQLATMYGNSLSNSKYCLIQSLADLSPKTDETKSLLRRLYVSKSYEEVYKVYSMEWTPVVDTVVGDISHGEDVENGYTVAQQEARLYDKHIRDIM